MENPFFSIIIPTFNSENTLRNALISILNQSFSNFEILIVDGFSKDKTLSIAENFCEQRMKIICEKDEGVYDAMNKGLQIASGEWLYFLGSDDIFFDNDVLLDVAKLLTSKKGINVMYGNVQFQNYIPFWAGGMNLYGGKFDYRLLCDKNICHQSIFYKKAFIEKNDLFFSMKYPVCADWEFNLKSWVISPFYYYPRTIAFFSAGGISSSRTDNFIIDKEYYKSRNQGNYVSYIFTMLKNVLSKITSCR